MAVFSGVFSWSVVLRFLSVYLALQTVSVLAFQKQATSFLAREKGGAAKAMIVSSSSFLLGAMKDDPEWTFLDTGRFHVKGGDGGNSAYVGLTAEDPSIGSRRRNESNHNSSSNHKKGKKSGRGKRRRKNKDEEQSVERTMVTATTSIPAIRGGKGGNGGSIYLVCDGRLDSLMSLTRQVHFEAPDGEDGSTGNRDGPNGSDKHIRVPPGTIIRELHTQALVGELSEDGESILLAGGGKGGCKKNNHANGNDSGLSCDGEKGEERWLSAEFKIDADVGIVGMANSGKSSLLASVSNAKPKIADYPFTTTCPNLGLCEFGVASKGFTMCDLPGLIDGASEGAGMGEAFLRHVENCKVLLHVVDASKDPLGDFEIVNRELGAFDGKTNIGNGNLLADKPQVVAVSKSDKIPEERMEALIRALEQKAQHPRVFSVSSRKTENLGELMNELSSFL